MNDYVKLATKAINELVKNNNIIKVTDDINSKLLNNKAGVFVSIHHKPQKGQKEGELRGCIGTFEPTKENIAQEIIDNSIASASRDYRFPPINKDELDNLVVSVDILTKPDLVNDIQTLNPKKYGILIKSKKDSRSGLLLPDLPGVDTIHDQMAITLNKAVISTNEPIDIYRFEVRRYK